jgi:hypothetical protein
MTPFTIEWEAPEFEYRRKGTGWYWITIIVAALIVAVAVWQRNFLFGFFVVIAEALVIVWGSREPRTVAFVLDERGLTVDRRKFYPLSELESFSVDENAGDLPVIIIRSRRKLLPTTTIIVPKERFGDVRQGLKLAVREVVHEPTLTEALERFLRF